MTKIVCISDTHNKQSRRRVVIPPCDILLHAGDATMMGKPEEIEKFARWFGSDDIQAKHRVFIPGNHDWLFQRNEQQALDILDNYADNQVEVLNQQSMCIEGFNIYGEPRQPWFFDWAFNEEREDMRDVWEKVPANTDILVTHGPPYGRGDLTKRGEKVGCIYQYNLVRDSERIKLVVCGHIHSGYGVYDLNGTTVANASVCNEKYDPVNEPIVIDL